MKITEANWKEKFDKRFPSEKSNIGDWLNFNPVHEPIEFKDFIQSLITSVKQEEREKTIKFLNKKYKAFGKVYSRNVDNQNWTLANINGFGGFMRAIEELKDYHQSLTEEDGKDQK